MSWGLVMPAPLSGDLRERIVAAIRDGSSMRGAAARFSVSPSSAIKLMARFRATGSVAPARYGGHRRPVLLPHEELLRALVTERSDITLAEIRDELRQQRGISVCLATIHVSLRRLGLRFKKRMARPVRKRLVRGDLTGLRQRIRSRGCRPGQDGGPRALVLIRDAASSAVFLTRIPERRFNRQAISLSPPADFGCRASASCWRPSCPMQPTGWPPIAAL